MAIRQSSWLASFLLGVCVSPLLGQTPVPAPKSVDAGLTPLNEQKTVLLDIVGKRLVLKG